MKQLQCTDCEDRIYTDADENEINELRCKECWCEDFRLVSDTSQAQRGVALADLI